MAVAKARSNWALDRAGRTDLPRKCWSGNCCTFAAEYGLLLAALSAQFYLRLFLEIFSGAVRLGLRTTTSFVVAREPVENVSQRINGFAAAFATQAANRFSDSQRAFVMYRWRR
jgi:hypothetical protein